MMTVKTFRPSTYSIVKYLIAFALIAMSVALMVTFFERWLIENTSLAIDWKQLWSGLQGGHVRYDTGQPVDTGLRIAPWSIPFVLPFGFLTLRSSWGLLNLITFAILILSVPYTWPRRKFWLCVFLLVSSAPALHHAADGNFEGLIIAGLSLAVYAYRRQHPLILALGMVMATAKIQETWIFTGILAFYLLTTWPRRKLIEFALVVLAIVIPCMLWLGQTWISAMFVIHERGSIVDMTLATSLARLGVNTIGIVISWIAVLAIALYFGLTGERRMSREKAGMLVCASLLLAPYAVGNSLLTVLAIGIIPLLQKDVRLGLPLVLLLDLTYVLPASFMFNWGSTYLCGVLLVTLVTCGLFERHKVRQTMHATIQSTA
jgi:hypothetical protein